jgi:hypothetical protein
MDSKWCSDLNGRQLISPNTFVNKIVGCSETIYPNEVLVLEENPDYAYLKFRGIDGL